MWCGGMREWGEDGVPDHGEEEAAVEVHVRDGCPNVDGFHSSLPVPFGSSLECGAYPVDAIVGLLNVKCTVALSVLTQPDYQCPLGSPMYIHLRAILRETHTPHLSVMLLGPVLLQLHQLPCLLYPQCRTGSSPWVVMCVVRDVPFSVSVLPICTLKGTYVHCLCTH